MAGGSIPIRILPDAEAAEAEAIGFIGFGSSLERGNPDLKSYLEHIRSHDPGFADFLEKPQTTSIPRKAFNTSFYVTGSSGSGKSFPTEYLAYQLAQQPKASVWILDPHSPLAVSCSNWKSNLGRDTFYFDVNLAEGKLPIWNPFDQLHDYSPDTVSVANQEQVRAFSIIAGFSEMTDNMKNLLSYCIFLMLMHPNGSMQELHRLMDSNRDADLVEAGMNLPNQNHRDFFQYEFGKKTMNTTKDAITVRLNALLSIPLLARLTTGNSTFSISKAFNRPGVYIFNLSQGALGEAAAQILGRLILAQLQRQHSSVTATG